MSEPTGGIATLGINLNMFVAQLVNFIVVLLVLWRFAYKPLVKILDDRSKKIEESLKQSEAIEVRVKQLEIEQKQIIASAKGEAMQILETAKQDADARKQELLAAAKKEVEHVVAQGKEQLQAEKTQMLQEAKAELIQMAVVATKKILESEVDEKASQKIASDVIQQMS
jgi:F-type H+-transporting ATPase subunit b